VQAACFLSAWFPALPLPESLLVRLFSPAAVASGWFTYASVAALLSLYAAYVVVVAVADFSKRLGVEWGEVARTVHRRVSGRWRVEMVSPLLQEDYGTGGLAAAGRPFGEAQPLISSPSPPPPPPLSPGSLATVPAERGGSLPVGLGAAAALGSGSGSRLSSPSPAPIDSGGRVTSLPQLSQPERGQQWLERRRRWVGALTSCCSCLPACLPACLPCHSLTGSLLLVTCC
jgi:hypothetical protein